MSTIIDLADAIVMSLNAGEFLLDLSAVRAFAPSFSLEEFATPKVTVVPKAIAVRSASRADSFIDYTVDIAIQMKSGQTGNELPQVMQLVTEVLDHLRNKRLSTYPDAAWISITNDPIFAPEHLDQHKLFTSIVTVTYRMRR